MRLQQNDHTSTKRSCAINDITQYYNDGKFFRDLQELVAVPTESQRPESKQFLYDYLTKIIAPKLKALGFTTSIHENPDPVGGPVLIAERFEDQVLPTALFYGHGDVVVGQEGGWHEGLSPWKVTVRDGKIYGRGVADNKGQHWIGISALKSVIRERGQLGFNCKILIDTCEEIGSPGLKEFCNAEKKRLEADLLIASDGPRLLTSRPAVVLGARGQIRFNCTVELRNSAHHSGNWGGLLKDPGLILVHALATIADKRGQIRIPEWRPRTLTDDIRDLIRECTNDDVLNSNLIETDWGEESLTPGERLLGWNSFSILALELGDPQRPVNAIQPRARACCQLRFVVGTDPDEILPALRRHLDAQGFGIVDVSLDRKTYTNATRMDAESGWAKWAVNSVTETTGTRPHVVPNIGGTVPNHIFADTLGLPTIWIPHSYPDCSQHTVNEHLPESTVIEGLQIMTGLFWDLEQMDRNGMVKKASADPSE